jgi:putative nucleotidyltransferase with HDIG domain
MLNPHDIVKGVSTLVSLPEICVRVNEMAENPRYSAMDIGKVISHDAGLAARLLKIVNSAFYNKASRIDTISRAITVIGARDLRDLVLATSAIRTFTNVPSTLMDMDSFWRHSIATAAVAKILASHCRILHAERLFVAGLLHDVGQLVLCIKIPELMRVVLFRARDASLPPYRAEHEVFGFDHSKIGCELMRLWRLPDSMQEIAEFHHAPGGAQNFSLETAIVHLAGIIANQVEPDGSRKKSFESIDPVAWEITGLNEDIIPGILPEARSRFVDAQLMLLPGMRLAH